jgi:hypothetical protein
METFPSDPSDLTTLVLYGSLWFFLVLFGSFWFFLVLFGSFWFFLVLFGSDTQEHQSGLSSMRHQCVGCGDGEQML